MLAALLALVGIQLLIAFLHHNVSHVPTEPLALELGDDDNAPQIGRFCAGVNLQSYP
jgi:hypothetical protein